MRIAYLINQYPTVSHSFIRREIKELEAQGAVVLRFALRPWREKVVDPADAEEARRTRYVQAGGAIALLGALLLVALGRPARFLVAWRAAVRLGRRSHRGVGRHLAYLAEASLLARWMKEEKVEHLHAHFGTNSAAVAMLVRLLGGPSYSFTVHGPEEFDAPGALSLGEKIQHAAFVVGVSSFGRSQLYRWSRSTDWEKIHVVHCGLAEDYLHQTIQKIPADGPLVCVGRICEQKGQLLLLEAVGRLAGEGLKVPLVFVGDGDMRPQMEAAAARLGITEQIKITGWATAEQVRQHVQQARALVLPSFAEGLPVVIMEAFALGRPVVSTFVAGIPELVEPAVNGWLVPAGSVAHLATALRDLLASPCELLESMGSAGRQRVLRDHHLAIEVRKLHDLFVSAVTHVPPAAGAGTQL
ncbi:MAG: glycosyltransferase [Phycisphaeraceae bacterium]|nr:glycosyltransferase [Phycisphaeraceae bacterium]